MLFEKQFVEELGTALRLRKMQQGTVMLDGAEAFLAKLNPDTSNGAAILLLVAQWVDVGYRDHRFLEPLIRRFQPASREQLSIGDYRKLRMVEAFRDLATGELDSAIETLELVLKTQRDLPDDALGALAHFWKGRAHRKKGEYEASLADIVSARELAQKAQDKIFTAVIQIQESWLLFQKGQSKEALQLLDCAESVLKSTDHFVALGNIESARGRIVRRYGEYAKALEHFQCAIEIYSRRDANHVNLARALVNAAYVRRLLALQIRRNIDSHAESRRARAASQANTPLASRGALRTRYQQLSHEALQGLTRAREIYAMHEHTDGIGNIALNLGYLYLDRGDIDHATPEATQAYHVGVEKNDHILMARARVLQAAIENAHVEEQTGEDVDIAVHGNHAKQYSEEALTLAHGTQNHRLLASACIARGMTAANDFFQEWEIAKRCAAEAAGLIGPGENDSLVEDLALLKSRIVQASGVNDTLREWSEGMVGNKTFQQISEEFAEIVIPKVWMRENRKISRVAACLSISPKKVRRILRSAGSVRNGGRA